MLINTPDTHSGSGRCFLNLSGASFFEAFQRRFEDTFDRGEAQPDEIFETVGDVAPRLVVRRIAALRSRCRRRTISLVKLPENGRVPRRKLGKTGVEISAIGLGGFHIAQNNDEVLAIRLVRTAIDHGINFMDNCWDYNEGRSEDWMGKGLQDGYRQRSFLMTKIDGRTSGAASEQIDQSLRRLRTDYIDLIQVHEVIHDDDPERVFARGGAIEALIAARQAGKLRFIGFTGHKHPRIHLAMLDAARANGFHFDAVQMPLNVMDHHFLSFEREVLPLLVREEIGVLGMKPMGAGRILRTGVVTARDCLEYALSLPTSAVITGCDDLLILEQALTVAIRFKQLSPAAMDELRARTAKFAGTGEHETFKTSSEHDGTTQHPHWLTTAQL